LKAIVLGMGGAPVEALFAEKPVQPAMAKTLKKRLSAQVVLFQQNKVIELSEGETSHDNHW
jgi:hypothetical protein